MKNERVKVKNGKKTGNKQEKASHISIEIQDYLSFDRKYGGNPASYAFR